MERSKGGHGCSSLLHILSWTVVVQSRGLANCQFLFIIFTRSFPLLPLLACPCCSLSLSLHLFFHLRLFFNSALLSCLTVSMLSSLLAASLKQMRTLRCGRRYTGLASQPCSVHHTDIRCTEPLTNQPSVILFNPSAFACLLLLLLLMLTIIPYIRLLLKSTAQTSAAFLWSRGYV